MGNKSQDQNQDIECQYCKDGVMHAPGMCVKCDNKKAFEEYPVSVQEFIKYWGHD